MNTDARATTKPSGLLIVGIFFIPYLCVWTLLDKKYSAFSRILGFGYMVIAFMLFVNGPTNPHTRGSATLSLLALCALGFGFYLVRQALKWGWKNAIEQLKPTGKETTSPASVQPPAQPAVTKKLPAWLVKGIDVSENADGTMHFTFPADMSGPAKDKVIQFCEGLSDFGPFTWSDAVASESVSSSVEHHTPAQANDTRVSNTHSVRPEEGLIKLATPKHGWFKVSFLGFPNDEESQLSEMALQSGMTINDHTQEAVDVLCFGDFASNAMIEKAHAEGAVVLDKEAFVHFVASGHVPEKGTALA
ncbi:hypothetical protein BZJ19_11345 [Salinivibrio proteolyticus]|uniref:hypothetical protein n=1 Tax=Salinivibrio proteolyticus TaxID=334715 RepID=UPI0009895975|nr:hypothetical protein [Salinivibrio proteolyticus]OOF24481.1 hypothetical protein BZJ19_11345 [Salinivibrio proteolyticus]